MGEIKFTNGIIMSALFAIVIITFAINFASDNDSLISLSDDPDFADTRTDVTTDLITFNSSISNAGTSFNEDNVQAGTDTATSGGQFKEPGKAGYSSAISTMTNSFNKIFGNEFAVISGTLLTILAFMFIRYQYKTWFGKDPD